MSWPCPGPGRPRTYGHTHTVNLDDEMNEQVRRYAKASRVTIAEALRELLQYGLEATECTS